MHVVAAEKASTCRSKGTKAEWIEKVYDYVFACSSLKGKISQMEVVEDFVSRPHKAVSFLDERGKELQEWNEQKLPKALPGYSGGTLPGRSTKEKGREEGKVDEDSGERRIRNEIAQEVVASIKEKASVHEDVKAKAQRTAERSAKQNWNFSHIENETEGEEDDWENENQMDVQWDEDHKLDENLGRRRMEGSTLQVEVMQKAPELVVHERMTEGEEVKCTKEKRKVKRMVC